MLKDELTISEILTAKAIALAKEEAVKVYQKAKAGIYSGNDKRDAYVPQKRILADNSLTCDSEGNCMLKDELESKWKEGQVCTAYRGSGPVGKGSTAYKVDCKTRRPL